MKARIHITPRRQVLDPQGKAIGHALASLGFEHVGEVRQGKIIELDVEAPDEASARETVTRMCDQLLANPVMEDYAIEIDPS